MDDKVKKYVIISIGIVVFSALLLPCFSPESIDGLYKCSFGFPIAYLHIFTLGKNAMIVPILLNNIKDIKFDIVRFVIDTGIYYFILSKCASVFKNKKIGVGTLSIMVFVFAISFFISFEGYGIVGTYVLSKFGFKFSLGKVLGINYSTIGPLMLFLLSFLLGKKYKKDLGAELATSLSGFMGIFLSLLLLVRITL